jgi:hypothetical protein
MIGWHRKNALGALRFESLAEPTNPVRLIGAAAFWLTAVVASPSPAFALDVPIVNGGLGPCSADFAVTDSAEKPVYDAKIQVSIVYGFMNKRKQDLEVGTNSDGKARFEGLPSKLKKKPLEFQVRSGNQTKTVAIDPEVDCQANSNVVLGSQ